MTRNPTESLMSRLLSPVGASRAAGVVLIALSLLRWPATALLVAPGWGLAEYRWVLIPAVQVGAEVVFWTGVWLAGREHLRAALARILPRFRIRAAFARFARN